MLVEFVGGPYDGGRLDGVKSPGVLFRGRDGWAGLDTVGGWWSYRRSGKGSSRYCVDGFSKTLAGLGGEVRGWPQYDMGMREWARDGKGKLKWVVVERLL